MNKAWPKASFIPLLSLLMACGASATKSDSEGRETIVEVAETDTVRQEPADHEPPLEPALRALLESYPTEIKGVERNEIIMADGTRLTFDDGRKKDHLGLLDDSDIEDMFVYRYELPDSAPEYLHDPGRSRSEALYKKMYGNSAAAVQKNLVPVEWFGQKVQFTKVNGAADSLRAVAREIALYPELKPYLKSSGTFYWRPVRGAKRMSAHSYGIAFDIAVDKSDYWLWKSGSNDEYKKVKYANRIPRKLVEIFQRHGFIWGGSWYHYDTMHFEFRPELLRYAALTE